MAASEIEQWWIDKFQENLGPIRKVAGWTTQQLADELGEAFLDYIREKREARHG